MVYPTSNHFSDYQASNYTHVRTEHDVSSKHNLGGTRTEYKFYGFQFKAAEQKTLNNIFLIMRILQLASCLYDYHYRTLSSLPLDKKSNIEDMRDELMTRMTAHKVTYVWLNQANQPTE